MDNEIKTVIMIEGEEYTECTTRTNDAKWTDFLFIFLNHLRASGYDIEKEVDEEILSLLKERERKVLTSSLADKPSYY
jgi:hypothetical protein